MRGLDRPRKRLIPAFTLAATLVSLPAGALPPDRGIHQYVVDQWSTEEGLPQVTVLDILQGHRGYMWIATQDGLARFDGVSFRTYRPTDHSGLPHNYINDIHEDSENRLWIGTGNGLSLLENGKFRQIHASGEAPGAIYSLAEDQRNVIWAGTESGLYRVAKTDDGRLLQRYPSGPEGAIFSVLAESNGNITVGGRGEIRHLTMDQGTTPVPLPDKEAVVRSLARGRNTLWIGTRAGLFRRSSDQRQVQRIEHEELGSRNIEALHVDRHDNLWVGTDVGLFRIRADGTVDESDRLELFRDAWIRSFAEDHEGNLWIGTSVEGITRLWPGHFRRFSTADGLADPLTWSLHQDDGGAIWLGTNAGVYRREDGHFREIYGPNRLPHPMTLALLRGSKGRMWVGTRQGLAIFENGRRIDTTMDVDWPQAGIYGLLEAPDGQVWISTREGLYRFDGELSRIGEASGLEQDKQRGIYRLSDGDYWVATDTGVYRGDGERFHPVGVEVGLDQFAVMTIRETADGTVWVGLQGGGLARFRDGRWTRYTAADGLLTDNVYFIAEDRKGHLWLSSHVGVSRFEPDAFERYDNDDTASLSPGVFGGMDSTSKAQCNGGHSGAGLQSRSGNIWLPTLDGAIVFDPDRLYLNRTPPRVTLESIVYGGETYPLRSGRRVELPPGRGDIRIDYTALTYRQPGNVRFRYRLLGYDNAWKEAENRRSAFYTNLSPGQYEFELRAINPDGRTSPEPASFSFRLQPRFYQTTAFRIASILVLAGLGYGGYRWRTQALHRRRMALERMVRDRTQRLTDLNERLQQASVTDPLTGLKNRRYLVNQIPKDLAYTRRAYSGQGLFQNRDLVFLMLDLDHFKKINDEHGHHAGDLMLTQFGEIIEDVVRESDYVIRWGGEEFLVVARHTEQDQAHILADRIRTRVRQHAFHIGNAVHVQCTCSIGGAAFPFIPGYFDGPGWEELIDIADEAVYRAKKLGRNAWVFLHGHRQCGTESIAKRVQDDLDRLIEAGEIGITTSAREST